MIMFEAENRRVRFVLPLPDRSRFAKTPTGRTRTESSTNEAYEKAIRQRWRALLLVTKAKLEAVDAGISTFEEEFMAHIMLPNGATIAEWAGPQIEAAYELNQMPALMPGAH